MNFNYFISDEVCDFILAAVELLADDGWRFLPDYEFSAETGVWRHRAVTGTTSLGLDEIRCGAEGLEYVSRRLTAPATEARELVAELRSGAAVRNAGAPARLAGDLERLRWFPLPGEPAR